MIGNLPEVLPRFKNCKCCRLPADVMLAWCAANKIEELDVRRGKKIWLGKDGMRALSHFDIEELIADADSVYWAYLNLVEHDDFHDNDGAVVIPSGSPWKLLPVQAKMARLKGNLVVECGSEVGKTRDVVLRTLWQMDRPSGVSPGLIAGDSDGTLQKIWRLLDAQFARNPSIGGGVLETRVKPYREVVFKNGRSFEMLLCGHEGKQFRGGHFAFAHADEVAKWKNPQQWNEFWRAGKPGCEFRIYSTPDGDYSSPFYALCQRAEPIGEKSPARRKKKAAAEGEPAFRKINIAKPELGPPFWTEARAASLSDQYGGESSVGWLTNVLGKWGSPLYSVFPFDTMRPNLYGGAELPFYRMVAVTIDREQGQVSLSASRLSPELGTEDGVRQEEIIARERAVPYKAGENLGRAIASFFPSPAENGWVSPLLFCGADLGSAQDPSEFVFIRVVGDTWSDIFRLHLRNADPLDQADIVVNLDHASGHQVKYSFDSGSFGGTLVSVLTEERRECSECQNPIYFSERLVARGFGNKTEVIDIKTGEPQLDPDRKDRSGNLQTRRVSNKEFGTQVLERKMQWGQLRIAWDGGAGDPKLSGPQLLVNHTASGVNGLGERRFGGDDDHHVDARRQVALAIIAELRGEDFAPSPSLQNVVSFDGARSSHRIFDRVAAGGMRGLFQHGTGVQGLFQ